MNINSKPRSLELLFVDGDPDGMRTATIPFQWTGHLLVFSRTQLKRVLARAESDRPGVYLLIGENEDGDLLYIGKSEKLGARLTEHFKKKDWWETAVLISANGDPLNASHTAYLERQLILQAKKVGKAALDNIDTPKKSHLTEAAQAHMDDFFDNALLVLSAVDISFLKENTAPSFANSDTGSGQDLPVFMLSTPKHGIEAVGRLDGSKFVVEAGSKAQSEWIGKSTIHSTYAKLFDDLVQQGVLEEEGNLRVFTKNYAFTSPSAAAAVINGRPSSGPISWKLQDTGQTLKDWQTEGLETSSEEVAFDPIFEDQFDPVPENASSENERNLARSKLTGAGGFA